MCITFMCPVWSTLYILNFPIENNNNRIGKYVTPFHIIYSKQNKIEIPPPMYT